VFLFDEPLSNLDAALRGQMRIELARLHETLEATMIYVTHDQVEAMTLADRIVVLREGRIEQVGTPLEIYHHPINLFVAEFIGSPPMNRLAGRVSALEDGGIRINIPGAAPLWMAVEPGTTQPGDAVTLGIRAEDLRPAEDSRPGEDLRLGKDSRLAKESRPVEDSPPGARGALTGTVSVIERLGALSLIYVDLDQGGSMVAQSGGVDEIRPHQKIRLAIDSARCHVFDAAGRTLPRTRPRGTPSAGAVPS
jgi:multiple sugar transport system ATP-binding protein